MSALRGLKGSNAIEPRPVLAVTMGDPSGIGPELILRAWRMRHERGDVSSFAAVADSAFLTRAARGLGLDVPVESCVPAEAADIFPRALPVVDLGMAVEAKPGTPSVANAPAVIASITHAVRLVKDGSCSAVVTSPIAKHVLQANGFTHPGHTEFLGVLASELWEEAVMPVMLLWSPELAVVPVTIHIPLADVASQLTTDLILRTGRIVARDLAELFGVRSPRLVLTGLNPHAGENDTIGFEDRAIIAPAVERLRAEGIAATGPFPADTLFHPKARAGYDVVLAMYHDQALVPIKTIAFDEAVNVTLGLPFVRTSPDHGTAFDIAGKGLARPESFVASLDLAGRLAKRERAGAL
ncbi:MAG: 4-hydroxythreonine-4-phosphate dehydrogenase PdxA [Hyphomicrobiales bacterium]|nr:4-hydroxythreonine-4-phosphate dehydrogenase PdxA [Hyphomicrobiales bacterium]